MLGMEAPTPFDPVGPAAVRRPAPSRAGPSASRRVASGSPRGLDAGQRPARPHAGAAARRTGARHCAGLQRRRPPAPGLRGGALPRRCGGCREWSGGPTTVRTLATSGRPARFPRGATARRCRGRAGRLQRCAGHAGGPHAAPTSRARAACASAVAAADHALRHGLCSLAELRAEADAVPPRVRGRPAAALVADLADADSMSAGESLSRVQMFRLGLPETPSSRYRTTTTRA